MQRKKTYLIQVTYSSELENQVKGNPDGSPQCHIQLWDIARDTGD